MVALQGVAWGEAVHSIAVPRLGQLAVDFRTLSVDVVAAGES